MYGPRRVNSEFGPKFYRGRLAACFGRGGKRFCRFPGKSHRCEEAADQGVSPVIRIMMIRHWRSTRRVVAQEAHDRLLLTKGTHWQLSPETPSRGHQQRRLKIL